MKQSILGILSLTAILLSGCSQSESPNPKYTDLSVKMDEVVKRTQGDPSKQTPEDQKVVYQAKTLGMTTPPGY